MFDLDAFRADVRIEIGRIRSVPSVLDFSRIEPEPARAVPPPLQAAIEVPESSWPDPVRTLAARAVLSEWIYRVTYAKGYVPHGTTGRPSAKPKQTWAVRMMRDDCRAVAVRTDAAWTSFWTWSPRRMMERSLTLAGFMDRIGKDF
jgi:hypothetical protein